MLQIRDEENSKYNEFDGVINAPLSIYTPVQIVQWLAKITGMFWAGERMKKKKQKMERTE